MIDPLNVRPGLAYLKAVAARDYDGIRALTDYDGGLEVLDSLAYLTFCFIREVADDPRDHIDRMLTAASTAERGHQ